MSLCTSDCFPATQIRKQIDLILKCSKLRKYRCVPKMASPEARNKKKKQVNADTLKTRERSAQRSRPY